MKVAELAAGLGCRVVDVVAPDDVVRSDRECEFLQRFRAADERDRLFAEQALAAARAGACGNV